MIVILISISVTMTGVIFIVVVLNATSEWMRARFVDRVLHAKIQNAYLNVRQPTDATSIDPRSPDDQVRHSIVSTLDRVLVSDYLASESVWLAVEQALSADRHISPKSKTSFDNGF
jgi:ABC-type lipoprotein release transport system permease subunit